MGGVRRVAWLVLALVPALGLPACAPDSHPTRRIAILRAVANGGSERDLFQGLDDGGVAGKQLKIVGGADPGEVHTTDTDVTSTVRRWVHDGVDAIVALSTSGAQIAAREAASTPVVFISNDPVATGLVHDERRPEGHLTGMTYRVPSDRTLSLVTDAFPGVHHLGCLYPPTDPAAVPAQADLARGAETLGLELTCSTFAGPGDAGDAASTLVSRGVDAIILVNAPTTSRAADVLRSALATTRVPVVANSPTDFAELLLEPDGPSVYHDLGRQLARILRGTKIADVPVQDPGHFLVVVNEVVARRNGHTIPDRVLSQATQVVR